MAASRQQAEAPDLAEPNDGLPAEFREDAYLAAHPDVREAVENGLFASGAAHFLAYGRSEARELEKSSVGDPSEPDQPSTRLQVPEREALETAEPNAGLPADFREDEYLAANTDIRKAVKTGQFASGAEHYLAFGRSEARKLRKTYVYNLTELDQEITRLRALERTDFSEWLRARHGFHYYEDVAALPADPLSDAYRQAQLAVYREIAGVESYNPWAAEPVHIDVAVSADPHPFPFSSRDGELIGGHLAAMANIFRVLWQHAPKNARTVLEYGCGTGFTTVFLAAAGYAMTAVDINAEALQVVDAMAANRRLAVRTFAGEFGDVPVAGERFDVILFYEAFHHCLDFPALLARLHDHLAPGGLLVLAGEPIIEDFEKPWGLRLDSAAVWEIRTKGWLELGFNEDFFRDLMARTGWTCERLTFPDAADIFVARAVEGWRSGSA